MSTTKGITGYIVPYVLLASIQYQFIKNGLLYADPFLYMGMRYFIASALCFAIARNFRPILNRQTILLSFFTFLSTAFWAVGLQSVSAGQSAVLTYTMPLFAIPLASLILKEKTSRFAALGAVIGFAGVATYGLALSTTGGSTEGIAFSVTNSFFWALYTIYYRMLKNQDLARTVATQFLVGGFMFLPFLPFTFHLDLTPSFIVDLGYVSVLGGTVLLMLWNVMARLESIDRLTTISFAVPATAVAIQALLTGEVPTPVEVAGVAVMFAGIYISRMLPKRNRKAPPDRGATAVLTPA
jgi:drug/metabolite transporter (DMT)-like permease